MFSSISKNIIFIERITLITVIKVLSCRKKYRINKNVFIFYNDELNGLNKLFKLFLNLFIVSVQKLDFRYDDLVDERGTNIGVKTEYEDLNKVLMKIYD